MDSRFKCKYCEKVFKHRQSLSKHEAICKKHPEPQAKAICEGCGHKFSHQDTLTRHKKKCKGIKKALQCDICSKVFDRKRNLERHILTHKLNGNQCEFCSATFKRLDHLNNHQKKNCNLDKHQEVNWTMLSFENQSLEHEDLSSFSMAFENSVTQSSQELDNFHCNPQEQVEEKYLPRITIPEMCLNL